MLAVAGELPTRGGVVRGQPVEWITEMKWDGVRALAYVEGGRLQLFSRNGRDVTASYPELEGLPAGVGCDIVLDGEIVALDAAQRPDFGLLQSRMHVADATRAARLAQTVPVCYLVFDLLSLDGHDLTSLPYRRRRELLEQLDLRVEGVAVPPTFDGDPRVALAVSGERGLEGVVCKRADSRYEPGRRSAAWVKVKHQRMQEVVIVGWQPGEGRRSGEIGALLLAVHDVGDGSGHAALRYAGQVGTGFSDDELRRLRRVLEPLRVARPPLADVPREHARDAVWVSPELVGEVTFGEWTRDQRLRHPSWRGLRPDKTADDVVVEESR